MTEAWRRRRAKDKGRIHQIKQELEAKYLGTMKKTVVVQDLVPTSDGCTSYFEKSFKFPCLLGI
jgi:hypothetical protein